MADASKAPILEIGKILAARGHRIEFGTLKGQERWAEKYDFIEKTYILGPGVLPAKEEEEYIKMSKWNIDQGFGPVLETKKFLDCSWPQVYGGLQSIMANSNTRPDFVIADYLVDAVRDMQMEFDIPIAMHWPQMPTMMLPASYIPGYAGLQVEVVLSESATILQRIRNELVPVRCLPALVKYYLFLRSMRRAAGVERMLPTPTKPDHLLLVNSCFAIETPKDLPPLVNAIGPVLAEKYPSLTEAFQDFLDSHDRVLYIALGTHVILGGSELQKILNAVVTALNAGHIDGTIWAIRDIARKQFSHNAIFHDRKSQAYTMDRLLESNYPDLLIPTFAPQRAILDHPHTRVYLTHGGASSTNETIYHGVPAITLGVYFDQLQNAIRLKAAGVSESLDRNSFTSSDVVLLIAKIISDTAGSYRQNCLRVKSYRAHR